MKIGDDIAALSYLVVSTWNSGFDEDNCDGLIGFALKEPNDGNPTYMDSLKEAGVIDKKIFGLYLNDLDVDTEMEGIPASNLEIGGYDLETYSTTGQILVTIPITDDSFWQNDFMEIYVDNSKIASTRCVVFDSGTTLVYADSRDYIEILDYMVSNYDYNCEVKSNTLYCDCSDIDTMPAIYFKYDGVKLKLEPSNMWEKYEDNKCLMDVGDAEEECWLLGGTFMSRYYSIHDMDNMEISFAPAVLASTGSSSTYLSIALGIWLYF